MSYPGTGNCNSTTAGNLPFSPANMISAAVKQRSAFCPVLRTGTSPPPGVTSLTSSAMTGLAGGWAHPILNGTGGHDASSFWSQAAYV